MGKATITSNLGAGQYGVDIVKDLERVDAEILDIITVRLPDATAKKNTQILVLSAAQSLVNIELDFLDTIIQGLNDIPPTTTREQANAQTIVVVEKSNDRDKERFKLVRLTLTETKLSKRHSLLTSQKPSTDSRQVWCCDLSENLSGDIATFEFAREDTQIVIQPGFFDSAVWTQAADGIIQPVISSSAEATYFNKALLPGFQKFRPIARFGFIFNLDEGLNTCDVNLDAAISSQQMLDVNQTPSLISVPIVYMDCDAQAFTNGDHVVVMFENFDWEMPKVIGFVDNPKPCLIADFNLDSTTTAEQGALFKTGAPWEYLQRTNINFGTVNWHNTVNDQSVSWHLSNSPETSFRYDASGSNASIYFENKLFLAPHPVWGACITQFVAVDHLIVVTKAIGPVWEVYKLDLTDIPAGFVLIQDITAGIGIYDPRQSFFFNDSGSNATCVGKYSRNVVHSTGAAIIDDVRVMDLTITDVTAIITLDPEQALSDRTVDHIATYSDIMFFSVWFGKNTHYDFEVLENSERTMFTDYDGPTFIPINLKYDESYILDEQIDTDESANPDDVSQTLTTTTTLSLLVDGIEKIKPYELTQTYSTTWTFNEIMGENVDYASSAADTVISRTMLAFDARDSNLGYYLELEEIRTVNVTDPTPEDGFPLDETGSTTRRKNLISFNGVTLDSREEITPFSGTRDFASQKNAAGLAASTFIPGALPDPRSHIFVDDTFQSTGITDMNGAFNRIDKWAWMPESLQSGLAIGTVGSVGSFLSSLPEDHFVPGPDPNGTETWIFNRYLFGDNYGAINRVGDVCQIIEGMSFVADFSDDHDIQFTGTFHKELTGGDIDTEVGNIDVDQVFFG